MNEQRMADSHTKHSPILTKHCRVCGDKATTYNFNVITCDSCKSFFRRTAPRESELKCSKNGNCEMTIKNRKACAKCRYENCLKVGMEKSFLFKRKHTEMINGEEGETYLITKELINSFKLGLKPQPSTSPVNEAPFPSLSNYERRKISEICGYYDRLIDETKIKEFNATPGRKEWLELSEKHAELIVRLVKNITPFQKYSIQNKMILCRSFLMAFTDFRFLFHFCWESDTGIVPDIYNEGRGFRISIHMFADILPEGSIERWREVSVKKKALMLNDTCIRDMMITLALFRDHEKITETETLRLDYLEHLYLLKRYLQIKLKNRDKVDKHLVAIQRCMDEYKYVEQFQQYFYGRLSAQYDLDLIKEIYLE